MSYTLGILSNDYKDNNINKPTNKPVHTKILEDTSKYSASNKSSPALKGDTDNPIDDTIISNPWKYLLFVGCFILGTFIAKMSKKR